MCIGPGTWCSACIQWRPQRCPVKSLWTEQKCHDVQRNSVSSMMLVLITMEGPWKVPVSSTRVKSQHQQHWASPSSSVLGIDGPPLAVPVAQSCICSHTEGASSSLHQPNATCTCTRTQRGDRRQADTHGDFYFLWYGLVPFHKAGEHCLPPLPPGVYSLLSKLKWI